MEGHEDVRPVHWPAGQAWQASPLREYWPEEHERHVVSPVGTAMPWLHARHVTDWSGCRSSPSPLDVHGVFPLPEFPSLESHAVVLKRRLPLRRRRDPK